VFFSFTPALKALVSAKVSIQDKEIEYFTFSYIHGSWLFILWFHCGFCNKKGTFRVFTGFGHLQTSEDSEQIKYLEHFKIKIIPCKRK
jgi:hypothetical protein